jgi:hypothetical protein
MSDSVATFTTAVGEVKVVSLQRAVLCLNASSVGKLTDAFSESWGRRVVVSFVWRPSADGGEGGSCDSEMWIESSFVVEIAISSVGVLSASIVRIQVMRIYSRKVGLGDW